MGHIVEERFRYKHSIIPQSKYLLLILLPMKVPEILPLYAFPRKDRGTASLPNSLGSTREV